MRRFAGGRFGTIMSEFERAVLVEAMKACGNNRPETARYLGLSLRTLFYKLTMHKIALPPSALRHRKRTVRWDLTDAELERRARLELGMCVDHPNCTQGQGHLVTVPGATSTVGDCLVVSGGLQP